MNIGVGVDLSVNDPFKKLLESLDTDIDIGVDPRNLEQGLRKAEQRMKSLAINAVRTNMRLDARSISSAMQTYKREQTSALREISRIQHELSVGGIDAQTEHRLRAEMEIQKTQLQTSEEVIENLLNAEEKRAESYRESVAKASELFSVEGDNIVAKMASGVQKFGTEGAVAFASEVASSVRSGDIAGLSNVFARGLETAAMGLQTQAQVQGQREGGSAAMAKAVGGLGKTVGTLATVAKLFAAVGGALAAVVKLMIDAQAQAKEMNASLLESGSALDLVGRNTGNLSRNLGILREATTDFRFARRLGLDAKEQQQILVEFERYGQVFRNIARDGDDAAAAVRRLQGTTEAAVTYARIIGMSTTETAQHMARMVEEFGTDMEGVRTQFSRVAELARISGYGTSRFFSAVLNATAGMALYNVRLEDTAALLTQMSDILGFEDGKGFLETLMKGFADESMTDRFSRIIQTGSRTTQEIIQREAQRSANTLVNTISDDLATTLRSDFQTRGIELEFGDNFLEQFRSLTTAQQREVITATRRRDSDFARQLENMTHLFNSVDQGVTGMAQGLEQLGPGGVLAMRLAQIERFVGPIENLSGMDRALAEQVSGLTGEAFTQFQRVASGMRGNFDELTRMAQGQIEMDEEFLERMGVQIEDGKVFARGTQDEIRNLQDFIMTQGEAISEALEEPPREDIRLARAVVQNTTDIMKQIEMGVTYFLERIYRVTESILAAITFGDRADRRERERTLRQISEEERALTERLHSEDEEVSEAEAERIQRRIEDLERMREEVMHAERGADIRTVRAGMAGRRLVEDRGVGTGGGADVLQSLLSARNREERERILGEIGIEDPDFVRHISRHGAARSRSASHEEQEELLRILDDQLDRLRRQERVDREQVDLGEDQLGALEDIEGILKETRLLEMSRTLGIPLPPEMKEMFAARVSPPVNDFIYRGGTSPMLTPISRDDDVVGARTGGPIDRVMSGGGGSAPVINIYGGDENRIYQVVMDVMRRTGMASGRVRTSG
ncbi:MAG: hypothetical protein LAT68_14725 [Cyclobacteriaceae bacterium]|nr:hypothetical protein [Cyclobacteriaceae bacterium]